MEQRLSAEMRMTKRIFSLSWGGGRFVCDHQSPWIMHHHDSAAEHFSKQHQLAPATCLLLISNRHHRRGCLLPQGRGRTPLLVAAAAAPAADGQRKTAGARNCRKRRQFLSLRNSTDH